MSIKLRVGINDLNTGSYRMAMGSGVDKFGPKGEKEEAYEMRRLDGKTST